MSSAFVQCQGYLADTGTAKGLGVFASRDVAQDEVVELSPVIRIESDLQQVHQALRTRVFDWHRLAGQPGVFAVALGYGSLYNHANPANLRYSADLDGGALRFVAARAIRSGEELTINYNDAGGDVVSSDDNWFRCNQVDCVGPPDAP
ncbi:MAG: SET domain-containing protein-lysine N-methyltransferase [bacterium]|jgi:SET domain-containing protein|nr:SET domain-containing protein-lysine N-methyltransferase [Betaproteobacteria bacterium]